MNKTYYWLISFILVTLASINIANAAVKNRQLFNPYHNQGFAIQISTKSLGVGFYGPYHNFTIGAGIGPYTYIDSNPSNHYIDYHAYVRKNFAITNHTIFGIGFIAGNRSGKEEGITINHDYNLGPYVGFEYAATQHVLLGGFITLFNYRSTRLSGGSTIDSYKALRGGSVQFAYLF